jgi:hypothetical protein
VGQALKEISADPDILEAMFEVLETKNVVDGQADITLVPEKSDFLNNLIAFRDQGGGMKPPKP